MKTTEQIKYLKILKKNEQLREELTEQKCINLEKIIKKIKDDGFLDEVQTLQIRILEQKVSELKRENKLLRDSLKKQLAKHLYNLIGEKHA